MAKLHAVEDQIAAVVELVGQALGDNAADDAADFIFRLENHQLARLAIRGRLQDPDDIAALAQSPRSLLARV